MSLFVGLDLGGTHVRAVVADARDERPRILADATAPTPETGADDVIAALARATRSALDQAGRSLRDITAIGCSAPGLLDHERGVVHEATNIPGFRNVPLAEKLGRALDGLPVFVDRDTVIAAIGEGTVGAARGATDFVYVTVSTGVGGAIVADGRILRGVTGTAGEIGHWPVALEGPRCGCGSYGCVESFAGGRKLAEQYGSRDAGEVYDAARAGDERAKGLVARSEAALEGLAVGLVNVLDPAVIVVGGGISEHEPQHVLEPMARGIHARAFAVAAGAVRVVPAALGAHVGMIGAVVAARARAAGGDPFSGHRAPADTAERR